MPAAAAVASGVAIFRARNGTIRSGRNVSGHSLNAAPATNPIAASAGRCRRHAATPSVANAVDHKSSRSRNKSRSGAAAIGIAGGRFDAPAPVQGRHDRGVGHHVEDHQGHAEPLPRAGERRDRSKGFHRPEWKLHREVHVRTARLQSDVIVVVEIRPGASDAAPDAGDDRDRNVHCERNPQHPARDSAAVERAERACACEIETSGRKPLCYRKITQIPGSYPGGAARAAGERLLQVARVAACSASPRIPGMSTRRPARR